MENSEPIIKKGYKQTNVGIIPEDWEIETLENLSSAIGDGIHSTPEYVDSSEFYFINGNNLIDNSIKITENTKCVSEAEHRKYQLKLDNKTILLSINGTIGNLAFYNNEPVILGKSAAYINAKKSVSKEFIFYLLQTKTIKQYFEDELTGSTIRNLSLKSIRNTPIKLPPLPEQQAIAEVLSDVDALITSLDQLITKKRNIKQGTMQLLLTGKKRLPNFSGDWETKTLGEIAEIVRGASPRPIKNPIWFDETSETGWVRISDVTKSNKYLFETTQKLSEAGIRNSRPVKKENLIMSICATVGRPILTKIDVCIHDGFVLFGNTQIDKEYLYYFLSFIEQDWAKDGQTGSQMNLNTNLINTTELSYPKSNEEQKAIAQILSEMDAEIEALETQRDKYKAVKQGMMQELLTGKTRLKL